MDSFEQLKQDIEGSVNFKMQTPRDFDRLRDMIHARIAESISSTTLKRFWNYLPNDVAPSLYTLNTLCRFIGYNCWDTYKEKHVDELESDSDPVMNRHINVEKDLTPGDKIRLLWHSKRVCDIEYMGHERFKVLSSEKTRIKAGDTFECGLIIENEPLYVDNLQQVGNKPKAYVCGKKNGVMWERI